MISRALTALPLQALPYNKRIMESGGDIGVPIVQKRKLTVPREPLFATDERMAMRQFDVRILYGRKETMSHFQRSRCG